MPPDTFPSALSAYSRRSPWGTLPFLFLAWLLFDFAPLLLQSPLGRIAPSASPDALSAAARWLSFLLFLLCLPLARRPLSALRPRLPDGNALKAVFLSLVLFLAFSVPWNLLLAAVGVPVSDRTSIDYVQTALASSPRLAVLLFAYPLLAAPLFEEILFRGAFLAWMARIVPSEDAPPRLRRTAAAIALLVPAVLFAALHAFPLEIPPLVILALLLSRLAVRHGLLSAVLLHLLYNLLTLATLLLSPA